MIRLSALVPGSSSSVARIEAACVVADAATRAGNTFVPLHADPPTASTLGRIIDEFQHANQQSGRIADAATRSAMKVRRGGPEVSVEPGRFRSLPSTGAAHGPPWTTPIPEHGGDAFAKG